MSKLSTSINTGESMLRRSAFSIFFALLFAPIAYGEQASVDFKSVIRPLTHAGNGILLSVSENAPDDNMIAQIGPTLWRGGPDDDITQTRAADVGAIYQMGIGGCTANIVCPGDNNDWTSWEALCRSRAQQVGPGTSIQLELWNEPDQPYFWPRSQDQYFEMWKHGVQAIRAVNPNLTIIGPSTSVYWWFDNLGVTQFLTYAKANNVLPDVITWHSWGRSLSSEVDDVRSFAAANGIPAPRISINEYLWWFDQYRPGCAVYFLNEIEQKQIESGAKSCWTNCFDNSLDGMVTPTGQPTSMWWLYERYAQMKGSSVLTISGGDTLDVIASQDNGKAYALVGRYYDTYVAYRDHGIVNNPPDIISPADVLLQHLDQVPSLLYGDRVHVLAELIKNSEQNASSGPVIMINADFDTFDGELDLILPSMGTFDAYSLVLTPAVSSLPGDYNGDGKVDMADYLFLRAYSGEFGAYQVWRDHFGQSLTMNQSTVPEPATWLLMCLTGMFSLGHRKR